MAKRKSRPRPVPDFHDVWIIYKSDHQPGQWVAHSINTDQLAVGQCVLEAVSALKSVMRAFLAEVAENPKVRLLTPAPKEVCARLADAKHLSPDLISRAEEILARRDRRPAYRKSQVATVDLELVRS